MADVDAAIDRLYQLPLNEFTPARNALARELKQPAIKELEKPSVPAWAVNQLYWRERQAYDRLVKASERLRAEHRKMLAGRSSDIREAEQQHREAIRTATDRIRAILHDAGQAATPATLTAVQETLEALPSQDRSGRLTRPLKPLGFEALSGIAIAPALRIVAKPAKHPQEKGAAAEEDKNARASERALAQQRAREERQRRERQREAERELKAAEAAMLRAEEAVKKAEKALSELRARRDEAVSEYQRARLRAHE